MRVPGGRASGTRTHLSHELGESIGEKEDLKDRELSEKMDDEVYLIKSKVILKQLINVNHASTGEGQRVGWSKL